MRSIHLAPQAWLGISVVSGFCALLFILYVSLRSSAVYREREAQPPMPGLTSLDYARERAANIASRSNPRVEAIDEKFRVFDRIMSGRYPPTLRGKALEAEKSLDHLDSLATITFLVEHIAPNDLELIYAEWCTITGHDTAGKFPEFLAASTTLRSQRMGDDIIEFYRNFKRSQSDPPPL